MVNSKYCVNHIHNDISISLEKSSVERKRVVCPVDPSHTVFEDKLQKHLRVCNKTKKSESDSSCSYFVPNCNCGNVSLPKEITFQSNEDVDEQISL